jgi:hypothetical protein
VAEIAARVSQTGTTAKRQHRTVEESVGETVEEKGSSRGIACVARISCPVRMCQPIPASPNNRTDRVVNTNRPNSATKIKSPAEGKSHRTHAGRKSAAELLEPIAIALNLIE